MHSADLFLGVLFSVQKYQQLRAWRTMNNASWNTWAATITVPFHAPRGSRNFSSKGPPQSHSRTFSKSGPPTPTFEYIYILKIRYQIGSWPLLNPRNACILSDTPKVILHVSNQYTNPEIPLTPAFILWQVWGEESGESRITNLHAFWYYTLYLLITTSVMAFHYVFYMYIFIYISTY